MAFHVLKIMIFGVQTHNHLFLYYNKLLIILKVLVLAFFLWGGGGGATKLKLLEHKKFNQGFNLRLHKKLTGVLV